MHRDGRGESLEYHQGRSATLALRQDPCVEYSEPVSLRSPLAVRPLAHTFRQSAPPHANLHPLRAIFLIPQKPPPTLADPDKWSPQMLDFVRICLHKNTSQRPDSSMLSR